MLPEASLNTSATLKLDRVTLPSLTTEMLYCTTSPFPTTPSPLSVIAAVLVTSIDGVLLIVMSVVSSVVLPSLSSPSSEVSVTLLLCPGLLPVTKTLLLILPVSNAAWVIV